MVSLPALFSDEGTFSVRASEKTMETVDENSGFKREKKPFEGAC